MSTGIFEFGWFGFGYRGAGAQGNLFPSLCAGPVRFSWCRGLLADALKRAVGGINVTK